MTSQAVFIDLAYTVNNKSNLPELVLHLCYIIKLFSYLLQLDDECDGIEDSLKVLKSVFLDVK